MLALEGELELTQASQEAGGLTNLIYPMTDLPNETKQYYLGILKKFLKSWKHFQSFSGAGVYRSLESHCAANEIAFLVFSQSVGYAATIKNYLHDLHCIYLLVSVLFPFRC